MTFDLDKGKVIKVETDIEGIDSSLLNFLFRITIDGVSYGFSGELSDGILTISIPPLRNVIHGAKNGQYGAILEASSILDDGSGYYTKLQGGNVTLKAVPSVKVNIEPEEKSVNTVKISSIIEENVVPSIDGGDPQEIVPAVDKAHEPKPSIPFDPWEALEQQHAASQAPKKLLGVIKLK